MGSDKDYHDAAGCHQRILINSTLTSPDRNNVLTGPASARYLLSNAAGGRSTPLAPKAFHTTGRAVRRSRLPSAHGGSPAGSRSRSLRSKRERVPARRLAQPSKTGTEALTIVSVTPLLNPSRFRCSCSGG